ncbi:MAG: adenylate cyclase [Enterovirga sp.]|nr:adenylate cyclase [Enterovirga sp.]
MSIEAPPLERKLVAILAADVEGYSRLMHVDEEATLATLSSHRLIVDGLIAAAGGHITSTAGDSVLAEFASVVEAVICAVEIQRSLGAANEPLPPERRMQFRIGLNVGDVMVKDGGIFGDGVNVAARVEALAPPGGICVTRGVRDHVRDRLPYGFEDIGDHAVKNIARPIHAFRIIFDGDQPRGRDRPIGLAPLPAQAPALPAEPPPTMAEPVEVELTFWKSAEAGGTAEEYRAYLDHFPDGTFASLAQARLDGLSSPPPPVQADPAVELAFWDSVKDGEDPALFSAYLDKYPDGEFRAIAEIKMASLG